MSRPQCASPKRTRCVLAMSGALLSLCLLVMLVPSRVYASGSGVWISSSGALQTSAALRMQGIDVTALLLALQSRVDTLETTLHSTRVQLADASQQLVNATQQLHTAQGDLLALRTRTEHLEQRVSASESLVAHSSALVDNVLITQLIANHTAAQLSQLILRVDAAETLMTDSSPLASAVALLQEANQSTLQRISQIEIQLSLLAPTASVVELGERMASVNSSYVEFASALRTSLVTTQSNVATLQSYMGELQAQVTSQQQLTFVLQNRVVNGNMSLDSTHDGAAFTLSSDTSFAALIDNWDLVASGLPADVQVSRNLGTVTAPAPYMDFLGLTSSGTFSAALLLIRQELPLSAISDWEWGTPAAKPVTLSFLVRVSVPGLHGGFILSADASVQYVFAYTVPAADAWVAITLTIPGDTSVSSAWQAASSSTTAAVLYFSLYEPGAGYETTPGVWGSFSNKYGAAGQVNTFAAAGDGFYLTGVQLRPTDTRWPQVLDGISTLQTDASLLQAQVEQATPTYKNRLHNGAFSVDQRYNGAAVLASGGDGSSTEYGMDRWIIRGYGNLISKFTMQRNGHSITVSCRTSLLP